MTDYKPGTVAKVKPYIGDSDETAIYTSAGTWATANGSFLNVTHVRPLMVLDLPADRANLIRDLIEYAREGDVHVAVGSDLDELADLLVDQIEAQTKPPRIPEPGLWGVVNAAVAKDGRYSFVRILKTCWMCTADSSTYRWDDLIDPVLVREGVQP